METGFIEDGYNTTGKIEAKPGFHPELNFEFRRMTQPEILALGRKQNLLKSQGDKGMPQLERLAAQVIVDHVKMWDLQKQNGDPVDITIENVQRVERHLFGSLYKVVLGEDPPMPEGEGLDMGDLAKN